jgi:hypothetical protein
MGSIYQSQSSKWILATISPPVFLYGYLLAMWKRHFNLPTKSTDFDTCSSTMTILPVLTLRKRHFHIMPCKADKIFTRQKISTYYPLPTNSQILTEPIIYTSSIVSRSHFSALLCHHRYINWEKLTSTECAEVSNQPHSEMYQKILILPTLDSYCVHKLNRTGDTKFLYWCLVMLRIFSLTVYWLILRMGSRTTINHFTTQHLMSIWNLIAR